jgi:hypothetical protein
VVIEGAGHRLRHEPGVIQAVLDWLRQCRLNNI